MKYKKSILYKLHLPHSSIKALTYSVIGVASDKRSGKEYFKVHKSKVGVLQCQNFSIIQNLMLLTTIKLTKSQLKASLQKVIVFSKSLNKMDVVKVTQKLNLKFSQLVKIL